jgi:hypothetical protein
MWICVRNSLLLQIARAKNDRANAWFFDLKAAANLTSEHAASEPVENGCDGDSKISGLNIFVKAGAAAAGHTR